MFSQRVISLLHQFALLQRAILEFSDYNSNIIHLFEVNTDL